MPDFVGKSVFLVSAATDPVVVRVDGRATFQNSGCLRDFIGAMLGQGRTRFVLDFQGCTAVDSTFLGVLAGAAIELRKKFPTGSLVVTRIGQRNLDLMRNLGLHRLVTIDPGDAAAGSVKCDALLESRKQSEIEHARLVLEAHENLVSADDSNRAKFEDVLTFLRNRVAQK